MIENVSRDPGTTNSDDAGSGPTPGPVEPRVGPLPVSGGWADVRTLITHGVRRRVLVALAHRRSSDPELKAGADAEVILAMVLAWAKVGPAGEELELTVAGVDALDTRDADAIFDRCVAAYRYGTRPLDPKADAS